MGYTKRLLSAALSLTIAAAMLPAAAITTAFAGEAETAVSDNYDNTNEAESKASLTEDTAQPDEEEVVIETPFNVFDIYNAHQSYIAVEEEKPVEPPSINVDKMGIDVSYAQGKIDWKAVKESGVDFAIIRAGYGNANAYPNQVDTWFKYNMEESRKVGMDVGVYWYSYAKSVEGAYNEAESCYNLIKDYELQYPVYFDFEEPYKDSKKTVEFTTDEISKMVEAFCSRLQSKGYYVGIYSYSNLLKTKIYDKVREKYTVWVASVGITEDVLKKQFPYDYGIWQYSWKGSVKGINGDVDLDRCYINFPYLISPETYVDPSAPTPSSTPTKPLSSGSTTVTVTKPGSTRGIDVSEWQGDVDWKAVKASGVDFAIIRAGYGRFASQKDACFDKNIQGAKAAGLNIGTYWYSYATNADEAKAEAEVFYNIIKDQKFEYPVYVDIESPGVMGLNAEQISKIADTFCSYMESKGYYIGIRSYASFLSTMFQPYIFEKYDVWVSHHDAPAPQYSGSYSLWQYSGSGQVSGVSTPVNLDYAYYNFPTIMANNHLNGF